MLTSSTQPMAKPYGPPGDHVIVIPTSEWAQGVASTYEGAERRLACLQADNPERYASARIIHFDRFEREREQAYLDQPIVEIDEETFNAALNCLPPLSWRQDTGVERFNCSEFTSGRITRQWARMGTRYFSRFVRQGDMSTYLTATVLEAAFPPAA